MASKKEWVKKALKKAGIDNEKWQPEKGWVHNKEIIFKVYGFYTYVFEQDCCKFMWAGLAKMAGGPVYMGLVKSAMLRAFAVGRGNKSAARNVRQFNTILLQMNKDIFMDLAWQHLAYIEGGIAEMEARFKASEIDEKTFEAWKLIDSGNNQQKCKGNEILLRREQEIILKEGYEKIAEFTTSGFKPGQWAKIMSKLVRSPLPNGKNMQDVTGLDGKLTSFEDRWKWISKDMWPLWKSYSCEERTRLVTKPLKHLAYRNFGEWQDEQQKGQKGPRGDKGNKGPKGQKKPKKAKELKRSKKK